MWYQGHLDPVWNEEFKTFNYTRADISEQPAQTQKESIEWKNLGYTNEHFTGFSYSSKNPMPEWVDSIGEQLGLTNCGFLFYKMTTTVIMPVHVDHISTYTKIFKVDRTNVRRGLIFLEDWKSGHYFEIDNTPIVNWCRGDFVMWDIDTPHSAANIGLEDRYTLQITGTRSN